MDHSSHLPMARHSLGKLHFIRVHLGVLFFLAVLVSSQATECDTGGVPVVRQLADTHQGSYGRAGLNHMTIAGAVHHGMKEVEVWMQTFAPGVGTPIHRHDCEEVFLVLRGGGTFLLGTTMPLYYGEVVSGEGRSGGPPEEYQVRQNNTFTVPRNAVHQVVNSEEEGDLQVLVVISSPPIRVFVYHDWMTSHEEAKLRFPYPWDEVCPYRA